MPVLDVSSEVQRFVTISLTTWVVSMVMIPIYHPILHLPLTLLLLPPLPMVLMWLTFTL